MHYVGHMRERARFMSRGAPLPNTQRQLPAQCMHASLVATMEMIGMWQRSMFVAVALARAQNPPAVVVVVAAGVRTWKM